MELQLNKHMDLEWMIVYNYLKDNQNAEEIHLLQPFINHMNTKIIVWIHLSQENCRHAL